MSEHFLNRSQISASLEQVGGEGMAKDVRMHAGRVEACFAGERAQDEECPGARERAAFRVQKQFRTVAPVEVRAAA